MNKIKWLVAPSVLIVGCGALVIHAQHPLQKPGSSLVELSPPVVIPSSPLFPASPNPLGTQVRLGARSVLILKVTSAPSGGSGGQTLDVYFQNSSDDGQTWNDFAEVRAPGTGTFYIPISAIAPGPTSVSSISDGSMGTNTAVQGAVGNKLRTKVYCYMGSGTTGVWAYQAFVLPD
jgi:hypothetical protein